MFSSKFGFHDQLSLCSYVPKKGRAVVLLSTFHHRTEISEGRPRKPQIINDYNRSKGGVDTLDQCVHVYSCSRKSNRWPTKLAFNMVDVMAYNAHVIFISHIQAGTETNFTNVAFTCWNSRKKKSSKPAPTSFNETGPAALQHRDTRTSATSSSTGRPWTMYKVPQKKSSEKQMYSLRKFYLYESFSSRNCVQ